MFRRLTPYVSPKLLLLLLLLLLLKHIFGIHYLQNDFLPYNFKVKMKMLKVHIYYWHKKLTKNITTKSQELKLQLNL